MKQSNLLAALDAATTDDLEAVEAQIAEQTQRLEALKRIQRVLQAKFGQAPAS